MSEKAEFEQAEMFLSHPFLNFLFKYSVEECFLNLFMLCEKSKNNISWLEQCGMEMYWLSGTRTCKIQSGFQQHWP